MTCSRCSSQQRDKRILRIHSSEGLRQLQTWRRRYDAVTIQLSHMKPHEARLLNDAIRDGYYACGCSQGRLAIAFAALLGLAALITGRLVDWRPNWESVVLCLFALLLMPIVTMLLSIGLSRRKLWRQIDSLLS